MRNSGLGGCDDRGMNRRRACLTARQVEALLRGSSTDPADQADQGLVTALAGVRALGQAPAPSPSAALAAMLEHGFVPPLPAPVRRPRVATRAGVLLGGLALAFTGAAAANALPRSVHGPTAFVLSNVTPFHFPPPMRSSTNPPAPTPTSPGNVPDKPIRSPDGPQRHVNHGNNGDEGTQVGRSNSDEFGGAVRESSTVDDSPGAGARPAGGDQHRSTTKSTDPNAEIDREPMTAPTTRPTNPATDTSSSGIEAPALRTTTEPEPQSTIDPTSSDRSRPVDGG